MTVPLVAAANLVRASAGPDPRSFFACFVRFVNTARIDSRCASNDPIAAERRAAIKDQDGARSAP